MTRVVHCKREPFDVYIGRPGNWGNPFVIGRDGDRNLVLIMYKDWLWSRIAHEPGFRESLQVLRGKVLGCWCKPLPCHGDILAAIVDSL